jgi:hypothetical protein
VGWDGIAVFWLRPEQSEAEAKAELLAGWWDDNDDFVEQAVHPATGEQLEARDSAVRMLNDLERMPVLEPRSHEHAAFLDQWNEIIVYDTQATVLVAPARTPGTFPHMWRRVRRLAMIAPALVWDSDYDQVIDVSLDVDEAYDAYMWCS